MMHIDMTIVYCMLFFAAAFFAVVFKRDVLLGNEFALFANVIEGCGWELRARVAAAIQRRQSQEHLDGRIAWALAGALIVLGGLGFAGVLNAVQLSVFGLSAFGLVIAFHYHYAARRITGLRTASLRPRTVRSLVPLWYMLVPVPVWCLGVVVGFREHQILAVMTSVVAALLMYGSCFEAAKAPAFGDARRATDEILDQKVRAFRIRQILVFTAILPTCIAITAGLVAPTIDVETSLLRTMMILAYSGMLIWSSTKLKLTPREIEMIADDNEAAA